ncbi:MAG: aldo/keto reductase [Planctomycetia bacterium]|nr:aldo/keto reductase [Planctomycetia bacterium]
MPTNPIGPSSLSSSRLAYGCWRLAETESRAEEVGRPALIAAVEAGYTLFDHADIYCAGRSESLFGRLLRDMPGLRERITIATKCGIRPAGMPNADAPYRYDASAEHIVGSCEGSLRRLGIETIDIYQLHRPDYLMHPEEVAAAFDRLRSAGKVREFGVSNFRPSQVSVLKKALPFPLIVQQIEISLACLTPLEDGTLDQCLVERLTPLAWSPLGGGLLGGGSHKLLPAQEAYEVEAVNIALDATARELGCSRAVVALAWLLKHPAGIVPIVGSTDPVRIREAAWTPNVELTRDQWYRLFAAARPSRLP